jgi:hypothetical protein
MSLKLSAILGLLSLACAIPATASAAPMRVARGSYQVQVLVNGSPLKPYWHGGENWLLGQLGERYTLRVTNRSARPIEAVVSVDGRDVIDGDTASANKGGYLVPAYGHVDVDGWRISSSQAAAFRFSSVSNSYAAQTGPAREVGVIGVAVFEQKYIPPPPPVSYAPRTPQEPCCMSGSNEVDYGPRARTEGEAKAGADSLAEREAPRSDAPPMAPPPARSAQPMPQASAAPMPMAAPRSSPTEDAITPGESGGHASSGMGRIAMDDNGGARRGDDQRAMDKAKKDSRPGLGTEYGEAVYSQIREVSFERATSYPNAILGARYNNRAGLIALGIEVDGLSEQVLRQTAEPFPGVERGYAQPPPNWRR